MSIETAVITGATPAGQQQNCCQGATVHLTDAVSRMASRFILAADDCSFAPGTGLAVKCLTTQL